jgi:putative DNA primase/helicase
MKLFDANLHGIAHRNCTPAMAEVLAAELGVPALALVKLGLGYIPAIAFKKGINYDGHWTFPELDTEGRAIGLSLRNRLDGKRKSMFPGSKHGLFFIPGHASDDGVYTPGGSRWVRVDEAGVDCPVCGKSGWCMVDAADPEDPAAACCPRTPSDREVGNAGAGFLHILDEARAGRFLDGQARTQVLPASRLPVLVVEGATDTAALAGLGMVAVGRPSATGGYTELARLTKDRDVVIFGENDLKKDGSHPGRVGAEKCEQALTLQCKSVRCIFPPLEHKDVRTWIVADRLSQEALEEFIAEHAATLRDVAKPALLQDSDVDTIATAYMDEHCYQDDTIILHHSQGGWFAYGTGGWAPTPQDDSTLNAVGKFMRRRKAAKSTHGGGVTVEGLKPTTSRVQSVVANLRFELSVDAGLPSWLDGRTTPDPHRILCFANGMLPVAAYLRGDDTLEPHTPDLFTATRLPFEYDRTAACPTWMEWLEQTLGDDPAKTALIQEWFGYNLIPDNSQQKMLMMIGLPGSGKGTAVSVLENLLGDNATSSSMRQLGRQFGMSNLPGKLAMILPDAIAPRQNREEVLQMLLSVVGDDTVPIEEKYKTPGAQRLHCRVTIACNNMPELPSENEAMRRRLMFIRFDQSFTANPDTTLKARLRDEMSGIMSWALEGLARLLNNGAFTETAGQHEEERLFRNVTNPLGEFMERWVVRDPNGRVTQTALYEAYKAYAESRGIRPKSASWLFDRLQSLHQILRRETVLEGGQHVEYVTGIDLRPWGRGHEERKLA